MKKIVFFSLLIAASIWTLVYVAQKKEQIRKEESKPTVVESQTSSSQSASSLASLSQSSSLKSNAPDYRLRILSEPDGASVYLDNDNIGKAPFEMPIPSESRKIKLSMEGYEDYERQVPAAKDSEGDLVWKIQLKKIQAKKNILYYSKEISPFSVQIKAVPLSEFVSKYESVGEVYEKLSIHGQKAKFCRVEIDQKVWVRVVLGPFATKAKAQVALKAIKEKHSDAFLSTKQKCLAEGELQ